MKTATDWKAQWPFGVPEAAVEALVIAIQRDVLDTAYDALDGTDIHAHCRAAILGILPPESPPCSQCGRPLDD